MLPEELGATVTHQLQRLARACCVRALHRLPRAHALRSALRREKEEVKPTDLRAHTGRQSTKVRAGASTPTCRPARCTACALRQNRHKVGRRATVYVRTAASPHPFITIAGVYPTPHTTHTHHTCDRGLNTGGRTDPAPSRPGRRRTCCRIAFRPCSRHYPCAVCTKPHLSQQTMMNSITTPASSLPYKAPRPM